MKKKTSRHGIDVNVDELDRIIDAAMREPLNENDGRTLKTAVHAMAERLVRRRNIRFVAYNTRFLILPWIQVPHLASHILAA